MKTIEELLQEKGIDVNEEARKLETTKRKKVSDRVICSCGHALGAHHFHSEGVSCNPSTLTCPCLKYIPVLKVTDVRYFRWKSIENGHGMDHALMRGMVAASKKNVSAEFLEGYACAKCKTTEGIEIYGFQTGTDGPVLGDNPEMFAVSMFLCQPCKDSL